MFFSPLRGHRENFPSRGASSNKKPRLGMLQTAAGKTYFDCDSTPQLLVTVRSVFRYGPTPSALALRREVSAEYPFASAAICLNLPRY